MATPKLIIDGKTVTPNPPKMVVWRRFLAFYEQDKTHMSVEDFLDAHVGLIVLAFGKSEVTQETVDEALQISEVVPFTREIFSWLQEQIFASLDKLPTPKRGRRKIRKSVLVSESLGVLREIAGGLRLDNVGN